MTISKFSPVALAAALLAGMPAATLLAADKGEVEKAIAAAQEAQKKADSVGGEWRDTGKFIKKAQALAEEGKLDEALKLANKAAKQGELGYQQAMDQKDAGMEQYFKKGEVQQTAAGGDANMITADLASVEVMHNGEKVVIKRDHDKEATLPAEFLKTDRGCPPFCVQPVSAAEGVQTIGEIEVLGYLEKAAKGDDSVLVVDSRTPDWVLRGTIPGSVNVPWNSVTQDSMSGMFGDAGESGLAKIMEEKFGAKKTKKGWDFDGAKTLVLFCNGIWCGQSSTNIGTLVELGYPADKLKWYRGGMQDWVSVGLTTVKP